MTQFRVNHYVPEWYQRRFIPAGAKEQTLYYLDLKPERITRDGHTFTRKALRRLGPDACFSARDLYTTQFGSLINTDIERHFFGRIDNAAPPALDYWATFNHEYPSQRWSGEHFNTFVGYLSLQKLRTPKGLKQFAEILRRSDRTSVLVGMQQLRNLYATVWTESVWCILDASQSPTKFIVSDHPTTVYNAACLPASVHCREHRDPKVTFHGSHTLFPLSLDKMLVLTNLSWAKNPYLNPMEERPNPLLTRDSGMFNFQCVQVGRVLSETDVQEINLVIKERAFRYIAAGEKEWLYPERHLSSTQWDKLGGGYLFMPDPRDVQTTVEFLIGYEGGRTEAIDPYGRRRGQKDYGMPASADDFAALYAFQGEYARVFGPGRRGRAAMYGKLSDEQDSPDFHAYHLRLESTNKALIKRWRKK